MSDDNVRAIRVMEFLVRQFLIQSRGYTEDELKTPEKIEYVRTIALDVLRNGRGVLKNYE